MTNVFHDDRAEIDLDLPDPINVRRIVGLQSLCPLARLLRRHQIVETLEGIDADDADDATGKGRRTGTPRFRKQRAMRLERATFSLEG